MRTLKFRVWERERSRFLYSKEGSAYTIDSTTGKPAYGHAIGGSDGISVGLTLNGLPYFRCHNVMGELENSVVQQFTGLLDREGKEIYEGDIVKNGYCQGRAEIVFVDGGFFSKELSDSWDEFLKGDVNTYEECRSFLSTSRGEEMEVIGNIFENKELLTQIDT